MTDHLNAVEGDNTTRLDDADALIWAAERDPRLASTMASIVLFDRPVDPQAIRSRLDRTTRLVPRMRQRVVGNPVSLSPPRWEFDPDFDLDRHFEVVECPGQARMRDALDDAGPFIDRPFDRDRPLFGLRLIQGVEGGRSALVLKAHHSIADGLGMLQIQIELFDFEPDMPDPVDLPPEPEAAPLSRTERLVNAIEFERARSIDAVRDLASGVTRRLLAAEHPVDDAIDTVGSALRSLAPVRPLSALLTGRSAESHHDLLTYPLDDLKSAGRRAGTRMNAAFVAAVARGLGLYHDANDAPSELLRMGMPVSVRTDDDEAGTGNHLIPIRLEVPLSADEPDHLISVADALIAAQRAEPALAIVAPTQRLLAQLPAPLDGIAFGQALRGTDFLTSNLPGSPVPMYIGSARVESQHPFGPTSAAALNVTLLSYLDCAHIGISVDTAAADEPARLVECLRQGFDWIVAG